MQKGQTVLVDTNAIIEAHRVGSWPAVVGWFSVETVDECAVEAGSGDDRKPGYVPVDVENMRREIVVHQVNQSFILAAQLANDRFDELDPGERDLVAFAMQYEKSWLLCSPDRACLSLMNELGLLDRMVSLEALQNKAGVNKRLRENFTEKWFRQRRTDAIMGLL